MWKLLYWMTSQQTTVQHLVKRHYVDITSKRRLTKYHIARVWLCPYSLSSSSPKTWAQSYRKKSRVSYSTLKLKCFNWLKKPHDHFQPIKILEFMRWVNYSGIFFYRIGPRDWTMQHNIYRVSIQKFKSKRVSKISFRPRKPSLTGSRPKMSI